MTTYLTCTENDQPVRHRAGRSRFAWLGRLLATRREHAANRRHIAYLRRLDRHVLADMGIDPASLQTLRPRIAPHAPAAALAGTIEIACRWPSCSNPRSSERGQVAAG